MDKLEKIVDKLVATTIPDLKKEFRQDVRSVLGSNKTAQDTIKNRPTTLSTLYSTQENLRRDINNLQQGKGCHPGNKFIKMGIEKMEQGADWTQGLLHSGGMVADISVDVPTHPPQVFATSAPPLPPLAPPQTTPQPPAPTPPAPQTPLAAPEPAPAGQAPAADLGLESAEDILQRQVAQAEEADKAKLKGKKATKPKGKKKATATATTAPTP